MSRAPMTTNPDATRYGLGLAGSLGLHGGLLLALTLAPVAAGRSLPPSMVEFELPPLPAPPPPPLPTVDPAPAADPASTADPAPARAAPPRSPAAPEPAATEPETPPEADAESELVELTGVTLTDDGPGDGWRSVIGNGMSSHRPLRHPRRGAPDPTLTPAARSARPPSLTRAAPLPPPLVPLADLARRPTPPALDKLLLANYPTEARRRGDAGQARVIARIDPDGRVRAARVIAASSPEFGLACQRTVHGSRWKPPRDRTGNSVATEVSYTCRFEVAR